MIAALALLGLFGDPTVEVQCPKVFVAGEPFNVKVDLQVADDGSSVPAWLLEAVAFSLDGTPLGERGEGTVDLAAGTHMTLTYDLAPSIAGCEAFEAGKAFELDFGEGVVEVEPTHVAQYVVAPEGLDFTRTPEGEDPLEGRCWTSDGPGEPKGEAVPTADLSKYRVRFLTNRGEMIFEMWPDVAPCHVRNFLDLVYTGFYDGVLFHRVMPGFMIQGGDPTGTGRAGGPRMMKAEFNQKKHVRGVLSMARVGGQPDSATTQFFVMHAAAPYLNGQYSAFGELVSGFDTLDAIAQTSGQKSPDGTIRPDEPQRIERALVLVAEAAR